VKFRSILCPVDFSAQSRAALRCAVSLGRRFGGRVAVLFVNDPVLVAAANAAYSGRRRFVDRTEAELARFVKQATAAAVPRKDIGLLVSAGTPADEILRCVKRSRSDLVVMGSHGLSRLQRAFFGSTTEQVLRNAHVPVLAIPPSAGSRGHAGFDQVTRVIAPIDLAGEWHSDAVRAAQIALALEAHLVLVHVLVPVQSPPWLRRGHANERRRIEKAAAALERAAIRLLPERPQLSTNVVVGDPAHEIARLTRRRGSLVVMSLRGTAGVWGLRRGAVAYHVLTHASTPVLALPRRRIGGRFAVRARKALGEILTARDRVEIAGIDAMLSIGGGRRALKR
jgi:nucleotide-binding universal stress UspA family protein